MGMSLNHNTGFPGYAILSVSIVLLVLEVLDNCPRNLYLRAWLQNLSPKLDKKVQVLRVDLPWEVESLATPILGYKSII